LQTPHLPRTPLPLLPGLTQLTSQTLQLALVTHRDLLQLTVDCTLAFGLELPSHLLQFLSLGPLQPQKTIAPFLSLPLQLLTPLPLQIVLLPQPHLPLSELRLVLFKLPV
jgi:hypothetical protein